MEEDRAAAPKSDHRNRDHDVLTVDDVAYMLRCSPYAVYVTDRNLLPYSRPGKRNLYRRAAVLAYLEKLELIQAPDDPSHSIDKTIAEIRQGMQDAVDGVRERARRRKS